MKYYKFFIISLLILVSTELFAQDLGYVLTPESSIEQPNDKGKKAHTHIKTLLLHGGLDNFNAKIDAQVTKPDVGAPPTSGYGYQTPASMACIYGLTATLYACNPNNAGLQTNSGGPTPNIIAIVDAYHYPNALADLNAFSSQFGLPAPKLKVVFASGRQPATSPNNWELEEALDLQWEHAMAPNAQLILVEAKSSANADLLAAIKVATSLVQTANGTRVSGGVGVVTMSWGESEFLTETAYDSYFQSHPGVVYFASSGDAAGTSWPCVSQYVVCVGGTTLRLDGANIPNRAVGDFVQEVAWESGGGGYSAFVSKPGYQSSIVGNFRGVPDIALDADPHSGAWVYYTPSNGKAHYWYITGGTSLSAQMAAGITINAGVLSTVSTSTTQLGVIYGGKIPVGFNNDISAGWCGYYLDLSAGSGWDPCTGVGSYIGPY